MELPLLQGSKREILRADVRKGAVWRASMDKLTAKTGNFFVKRMMATTHLRNQNELRPSSL